MNNNKTFKSSYVQLGECFNLPHRLDEDQLIQEEKKKKLLGEAEEQAKVIIQQAQDKAAEILQKADEQALNKIREAENLAQQATENGYAEGFQNGYNEGITKAQQEICDKVFGLDALTSAVFKIKKEIINSAELEILELSTAIAEKILRHELESSPELMQGIIRAAIDQLKEKEEIKIIVNPAMIRNLYEFAEELKTTVKGLKNIKIIEDRTIPKDGLIVESLESRIDARIETQLREIVKNMMQEHAERSISAEIPKEIEIRIDDSD